MSLLNHKRDKCFYDYDLKVQHENFMDIIFSKAVCNKIKCFFQNIFSLAMKPSASSRKPGPAASPVGSSPTIPAFAGATAAAAAAAASTPTELPPLSEDEAEVTERLLPPPDSLDVTDTGETTHGGNKSGHLFVKNKKAVAKPQNNTEVLQVVNETLSPSQNKFQVNS